MRNRDGSFLGYLSDPLTLGTSVSIRARREQFPWEGKEDTEGVSRAEGFQES